ncbi:OsmC family protein [Pleurocapsales cyanobacterium LEGE 10410]|nr:OsmC family protein [Pleurocapsales cyanobacterium LEGE 10410]
MTVKTDTNRINGINLDILNETVNAIQNDPELGKCKFRARNKWIDANHNCTTITGFYAAKQEIDHQQRFQLHADEPAILAGEDRGANPVEHLLNALASCVTTSIVAHAAVRGIHIEELESELEGDIDMRGYLGLASDIPKGYTDIRIKFKVKTDVENMKKLRRLAEFSPVYNTILNGSRVDISFEPK